MAKIKLALTPLSQVPVPTPGTRVPLSATSLLVRQAVIQWHPDNVGNIYIGDVTVTAGKCLVLNSGTPAVQLDAEDSVSDEDNVYFDLADIYIDAVNAGDKVCIAYTDLNSKVYTS